MNKFDKIEEKIIEKLDQVSQEGLDKKIIGDGEWTKRITELIGKLGKVEGYSVCASGFNDIFSGEWLFDIVWYKEEKVESIKMLTNVSLIVESEWSRGIKEIKYDFEKLLISNAKRRLMICQAKHEKIKELKEYFMKAIEVYELGKPGDRFMIAILDDYITGEFLYYLIVKK